MLPCRGCPDRMKVWTINVLYRHFWREGWGRWAVPPMRPTILALENGLALSPYLFYGVPLGRRPHRVTLSRNTA